jgi:hypothetical protein
LVSVSISSKKKKTTTESYSKLEHTDAFIETRRLLGLIKQLLFGPRSPPVEINVEFPVGDLALMKSNGEKSGRRFYVIKA